MLIAWDANSRTLDSIKAGTIDSTIAQKPYTMGVLRAEGSRRDLPRAAPQLSKDFSSDPFSPYPVFVDTGTSLVDKNNVDLYIAAAAQAK